MLFVSSDSELDEATTMALIPPPQIMKDYCKRTDTKQISGGFIPVDPTNFIIKFFVLSGFRDNPVDENAIRDTKHKGSKY